jgi:hypothetical protein
LGSLGYIAPCARVWIKSCKVEVGTMSVEPSKDVNFRSHQTRCVTREVGYSVAFDGKLVEGFVISVVVDDLIEALCVSLLSSNENDGLS